MANILDAKSRLAEMLGVDEIRTSRTINQTIVEMRKGGEWFKLPIDDQLLEDAQGQKREMLLADILSEFARRVVRQMTRGWFVETATGRDLDRVAGLVGVERDSEDAKPAGPRNRFEAIAEELKKL